MPELDESTIASRLAVVIAKPLLSGAHEPDGKMCVMEAVAYIAGEEWSDSPACVSQVIAALLRAWNDGLPDDETRSRLLKPLILPVMGTNCDASAESRLAWMAVDWLTRVQAPAWMRLTVTLRAHSEALKGLPEITEASWPSVKSTVAAARDAARAARTAASEAARAAARDAARAAAWDAA